MTMVWHDLKAIYIIVPGTGSNSFHKQVLKRYPHPERPMANLKDKHKNVYDMYPITHHAHHKADQVQRVVNPKIWKEYDKFMFIRDPFNWASSIYNKGGTECVGMNSKAKPLQFLKEMPFTPFSWGSDKEGNLLVDTIYKTEDLTTIVADAFNINPGHENQSRKPPVKWCDKCIELIREKFHREFQFYDFEESLKCYRQKL